MHQKINIFRQKCLIGIADQSLFHLFSRVGFKTFKVEGRQYCNLWFKMAYLVQNSTKINNVIYV